MAFNHPSGRTIAFRRAATMSQQREEELGALPYRELQARAKDAGLKASGCVPDSGTRIMRSGKLPSAPVHLAPQQLGGRCEPPLPCLQS